MKHASQILHVLRMAVIGRECHFARMLAIAVTQITQDHMLASSHRRLKRLFTHFATSYAFKQGDLMIFCILNKNLRIHIYFEHASKRQNGCDMCALQYVDCFDFFFF